MTAMIVVGGGVIIIIGGMMMTGIAVAVGGGGIIITSIATTMDGARGKIETTAMTETIAAGAKTGARLTPNRIEEPIWVLGMKDHA
jgi:hypothetical protein